MIGQWLVEIAGDEAEPRASLRIDLEDRGRGVFGHAYLFYPGDELPGFFAEIRLPVAAPFKTQISMIYLYPHGGIMTVEERQKTDEFILARGGNPPPPTMDVEFSMSDARLKIDWSASDEDDERSGSELLERSDTTTHSELHSEADLSTWDQFRQWAIDQSPREYVFRGQRKPFKLVSSFHRTWRNDLRSWINDDVNVLFGAVAEKLNYPLQVGNLRHNAAIWSILQHHGYPTPMLDWSFSPFVAAYFAFQDAHVYDDSAPRIFMFNQAKWSAKYGRMEFIVDAAPNQLVVVESMSVANPRHNPQQAITTVTNVADVEAFIRQKEQEDGEKYLTVCDLPMSNRPQIMRELELMGITYGSLFPGLDGVCRDMRDRLFAEPQ